MSVRCGDALALLPTLKLPEGSDRIDVLFLDGVPKESLAYLQAAEPLLADGAVVVADNAGTPLPWLYPRCNTKEAHLQAAEPLLAAGAVVVADNAFRRRHDGSLGVRAQLLTATATAGVFKDGGMKDYLAYVRSDRRYSSKFIESYFEWRDDVPDGLEVSTFSPAAAVGPPSVGAREAAAAAAVGPPSVGAREGDAAGRVSDTAAAQAAAAEPP